MKEIYEFFNLIYSCADPEWYLEIRKLEPLPVESHTDRVRNLKEWTMQGLKMAQNSKSLHFRVIPSKTQNRKDLAMATTLWADVERPLSNEEREAMKELSLIPSAVVNSGRGTHLYFALNKPIDPEKAQELNESLAYVLRGDAGAGHCSHTLRFPGSRNYKYIPKKYVSVKVLGHIYDPEFFGFLPVAKKKEVGKSSRYTAPVSLKSLQEKSNRCPIIEAALSRPESLSYYAWFSLACVTDEETFVEISRRDANRFKENETRQMHRYLKERRYSPYNCDKLDEARNCPKKGRCFLKRIIHE